MALKAEHRSLLVMLGMAAAVTLAAQWWNDHREAEAGARMAALARPGDIVMLSSETCVYCLAARRWLKRHEVAFEECFIERDALCEQRYRATAAQGTPTLLVKGRMQLGFDAPRVLAALQAGG
jgi:glutaredoxin